MEGGSTGEGYSTVAAEQYGKERNRARGAKAAGFQKKPLTEKFRGKKKSRRELVI